MIKARHAILRLSAEERQSLKEVQQDDALEEISGDPAAGRVHDRSYPVRTQVSQAALHESGLRRWPRRGPK